MFDLRRVHPRALRLFVLIAAPVATGVTACGGPDSNPYLPPGGDGSHRSEGTPTSPKVLDAGTDLPHAGQVLATETSYYKITGLFPGAGYSLQFSAVQGALLVVVRNAAGAGFPVSCFSDVVSGDAACIVDANDAGELYVDAASFVSTRSTYTIGVPLANDEGTPTSPFDVTAALPRSGSITTGMSTSTVDSGKSSYFVVHGLTAGNRQQLQLTASAGTATLRVYQAQFAERACSFTTSLATSVYCTLTAETSTLFVRVRGEETATFTLSHTDLGPPSSTYQAEGAPGSEVPLIVGVWHDGQVDDTASWYVASGLVRGIEYEITLSPMPGGDNADLYVYADGAYQTLLCSSTVSGDDDDTCLATAPSAGGLWIKIDGSVANRDLGASYGLLASRVYDSEGTAAAPLVLQYATPDLPRRGSLGTTASYYKVVDLAPATAYFLTLRDKSGTADMTVYAAGGFAGAVTCNGDDDNYESTCVAQADASGQLFVKVAPDQFSPASAGFVLDVGAAPLPQGSADTPLVIATNQLPFSTSVDSTDSYFEVTGLNASTRYLVTFYGEMEVPPMWVYSAAGFSTSSQCGTSFSYLNQACVATSSADGRLWIHAAGFVDDYGSFFTLALLPPPADEGTALSPFDLAGKLPYRGQVSIDTFDGTASYYRMTGLAPGTIYHVMKADPLGPGGRLSVYADSAYTSPIGVVTSSYRGDEDCRVFATADTLYIAVRQGSGDTLPSYYTLDVKAESGGEGSGPSPLVLSSLPHAGKVGRGASYYRLVGLGANALRSVTLTGLAADADLYVFGTAEGSAPACVSRRSRTLDESCTASADSQGNLWAIVDGFFSAYGTTFMLGAP